MIDSIGYASSTASNYGASSFYRSTNMLRAKWSTQLAMSSLGPMGFEFSGKSPYSVNPSAAMTMDRRQSELAVQSQSLVNAGYAMAKTQQVDSSLSIVNDLLTNIQTGILSMANGTMTDTQRTAVRNQIEMTVNTINSIGNNSTFLGQKLLDGTPIVYSQTGQAGDEMSFTPPVVTSAVLGSDKGTLSDLSAKLSSGNYSDAMSIAQGAANEVRFGRAEGGTFANEVQNSMYSVLNQMEAETNVYNRAYSVVASQSNYDGNYDVDSAISNLNRTNLRAQIGLTLLSGMNQWR
jgi:flagellin-like hook-associated protein FlgL